MTAIRSHASPSKSQCIYFLVVMVIAWMFYPCEVISRPDINTWYNIGPQSNQSINSVLTIANITPPTNAPSQPESQTAAPAVKPSQPSNPVQPAQPVLTAQPGQPTQPVQQVKPGQTTKPVQPAQPAQQTQPTQPVQPAQPGQTTKPVQPAQLAQPTQPAQTTQPVQPAQPGQTAKPVQPAQPSQNANVTTKPAAPTVTTPTTSQPNTTASTTTTTTETTATTQKSKPVTMSDMKSVGCFRDSYIQPRPLPKLIADFRDDSENATKRENFNDTILACGKKADEMGFGFFGIQSNGECWSGDNGEKTYSRDGPSTDCHNGVGSSGSNYVYRFVGEHAKPCKDCGRARTMCFPANARIQLETGISTSMKDLQVGDKVQTIDTSTNQIIYTDVIAFLHKENTEGLYRVVKMEDGKQVVLSARHLIYSAKTNRSEAISVVFADDIIPGDFVRVSAGQANAFKRVSSVSSLMDSGIYAPMTRHGTLLVNGVLVSCYAHWWSHDIAHKVMAPLRIWYDITALLEDMLSSISQKLFIKNSSSDDRCLGIHWYAYFLMQLSQSLPSTLANYAEM